MRKSVASCSAVLIAIAALAACGGGSSSKSSPLTPDTKQGASSSNGDGGSSGDFSKLVADASKQKFKITYRSGSEDNQIYEQDGKGNSVYGSTDSQFFISSSGTISCSKDSSGKAQCTEIPGAGSAVSPFLALFNTGKTAISAFGSYGHKSTKTIAGRTAQCLSAEVGGTRAEYCADKETGVLLEIAGTDASGKQTTGLEVTKFEEPAASDFTPPAAPTKVTIPPGLTIPGG